jgi:hypothetical protein
MLIGKGDSISGNPTPDKSTTGSTTTGEEKDDEVMPNINVNEL